MQRLVRAHAPRVGKRGFSLFELVIAAGLSAVFAAVVGSAFVSTSSLARDSLNSASKNQDIRDVADAAARYLTGASPAGTCADFAPASPAPIETCTVIGETQQIFLTASPLRAKFYSYTRPPSAIPGSDRSVLSAPDVIDMRYENNAVVITRQAPSSSASYTNPNEGRTASSPTPETVRAFDTEPLTILFRYYDSEGNQLGCPPATDAGTSNVGPVPDRLRCTSPVEIVGEENLAKIALVEVLPRVIRTIDGVTEPVGIDVLVPIDRAGEPL